MDPVFQYLYQVIRLTRETFHVMKGGQDRNKGWWIILFTILKKCNKKHWENVNTGKTQGILS